MNWDAIAAVAEGLGAIGVIATLVYLASQIRQAERATLASIQHSSTVQAFQLNVAMADPEAAALVLKGSADFRALDPVGRLRFTMLMRASFAWYEDIFSQARGGSVETGYWAHRRQALSSLLRVPGIRGYWQSDQHWFSDDFRDEVNRQLDALGRSTTDEG